MTISESLLENTLFWASFSKRKILVFLTGWKKKLKDVFNLYYFSWTCLVIYSTFLLTAANDVEGNPFENSIIFFKISMIWHKWPILPLLPMSVHATCSCGWLYWVWSGYVEYFHLACMPFLYKTHEKLKSYLHHSFVV